MQTTGVRRMWTSLTAATLGVVLLSFLAHQSVGGEAEPCSNVSAPCDTGSCPHGQGCVNSSTGESECECQKLGGCIVPAMILLGNMCIDAVPMSECVKSTFVAGGTCDKTGNCVPPKQVHTPTATPTATPTVTPTNTLVPNGGDCVDPTDCVSGNCV